MTALRLESGFGYPQWSMETVQAVQGALGSPMAKLPQQVATHFYCTVTVAVLLSKPACRSRI